MGYYNQGYYNPYGYGLQQQQNQNSIIWVQGEAGAKSYLVAPNQTVQLWDSEAQVIYLKSADGSGMPSIKTLDYTIRTDSRNHEEFALCGEKTDETINHTINERLSRIEEILSNLVNKESEDVKDE